MCDDGQKRDKIVGFYSNYQDATETPIRLIDDLPCDFVMLSVWNVEDNGSDTPKLKGGGTLYEESQEEIYWGFKNNCVHQLFPLDSTELIPVRNARDISVRCNKQKGDVSRVAFSCFSYESNLMENEK